MKDDEIRKGLKTVEQIAANGNLFHANQKFSETLNRLIQSVPRIAELGGKSLAVRTELALRAAAAHMPGSPRTNVGFMEQWEIAQVCGSAHAAVTPSPQPWDKIAARNFLEEIASAAEAAGFDARSVGSVSKRGMSSNDLDILFTKRGEDADPEDIRSLFSRMGAEQTDTHDPEGASEQLRLPNGRIVDLFFGDYDPSFMTDEDIGIGLEVVESLAKSGFLRHGNADFVTSLRDLAASVPFLESKVDPRDLDRLTDALAAAEGYVRGDQAAMRMMEEHKIAAACSTVRLQLQVSRLPSP